MSNKAAKAETKIRRICDALGISEAGHYWLDHAVDPFKDMIAPHPGYPDKTSEPSVVEVVKQTVVVSAPGVVNWDCSIFLDQLLLSQGLFSTPIVNNTFTKTGQGVVSYTRGGLVVRKATSGSNMDPTTTDNASCLSVDPALFTNEDCRVIGLGFEVHDTTQDLKKQGSVVVYRIDQPTEQPVSRTVTDNGGAVACISSCVSTIAIVPPPLTSAQALDIVGSKQWEAKEGVYVTPVQANDVNIPMANRQVCGLANENGVNYFPVLQTVGASNLIYVNATVLNVPSPWSMCGAFFSGLDPAATLTINFNYFIERFPNRSSSIRRLCYPSPRYDPKALELYSAIAREMPVGVTVNENGLGDWISGIANIASGVLSMIPHPIPRAIGGAIQIIGKDKLVRTGANQVIKAIESKKDAHKDQVCEKSLVSVGATPKEARAITNAVRSTNATNGTYKPPKKINNRPDRLAKLGGQSSIGTDNPWKKEKMKNTKNFGTNM